VAVAALETAASTPLPATIYSFDIHPSQVVPGEPITLSWRAIAERVLINKLDYRGRLVEPACTVPLSGTLVITDYHQQGNRTGFMLSACSRGSCESATVSTELICMNEWFFSYPPPELTPTPGAPEPTSLPIDAPEIVSFSVSPRPVDPTGAVTLVWHVRGASSVTIQWLDKQMEHVIHSRLPLSGSLSVALAQVTFTDGDKVQFSLSVHDADGRLMFDQNGNAIASILRLPLLTDMTIDSFSASPDPVERGGTVSLAWNAPNADSVGITRLSPERTFLPTEAPGLPASGSIGLQVPEDYATSITYHLGARDANGVMLGRYVTVGVICPYEEYLALNCPLTREYVMAAYEAFEGGRMVWRADTREIHVLYNDGSYETYEDTWNEGEPIGIEETPPQGLLSPTRGFGELWANQPGIRDRLGWATAGEIGYTTLIETARTSFGRYPATDTFLTLPDNRVVQLSGRFPNWGTSQ
jgi:hypothetical protein